jgi:hypothetical protein
MTACVDSGQPHGTTSEAIRSDESGETGSRVKIVRSVCRGYGAPARDAKCQVIHIDAE